MTGNPQATRTRQSPTRPLKVLVDGRIWTDRKGFQSALKGIRDELGDDAMLIVLDRPGVNQRAVTQWLNWGNPVTLIPSYRPMSGSKTHVNGMVHNQLALDEGPDLVVVFLMGNCPSATDLAQRAEKMGIEVRRYTA